MIIDCAYLAFQLSSHPYKSACEIRKQYNKNFLVLNPKYENKNMYTSYLGVLGGGALRRTQVNENFRAVRPHHKADMCITRGKKNHQFFIYRPQCAKRCILGYSVGLAGPYIIRPGPSCFPGILSPISICIIYNMETIHSGFAKLSRSQRNVCGHRRGDITTTKP